MAYRVTTKLTGIDELKKGLSALELDQYPFAMKNAINELSETLLPIERNQMVNDFDRPTTFTLNALRVEYATKTKLAGGVKFKDPASLSESQHYLYPNVYGVKRGYKNFEALLYAKGILSRGWVTVPGKGVKLDAFGNVSRGIYTDVLSWFEAHRDVLGSTRNSTDETREKKRRGTRKTSGYEYFIKTTRDTNSRSKLLPGIYKRTFETNGTRVDSVFIFVPYTAHGYQRTYKFHETAQQVERRYFKQIFEDEMQKALETAFPL